VCVFIQRSSFVGACNSILEFVFFLPCFWWWERCFLFLSQRFIEIHGDVLVAVLWFLHFLPGYFLCHFCQEFRLWASRTWRSTLFALPQSILHLFQIIQAIVLEPTTFHRQEQSSSKSSWPLPQVGSLGACKLTELASSLSSLQVIYLYEQWNKLNSQTLFY